MVDQTIFEPSLSTGQSKGSVGHEEILRDFKICCISRETSLLARREVLTGKAKFGIIGDGKEVPQVAMARAFQNGDFRSGYYRDQTFMFALGLSSVEDFFAQLYADPKNDPFSGGRQMNAHFATPLIDENGDWLPQRDLLNVSSDISSTAGQMARAFGLALASKKYRSNEQLQDTPFSRQGKEVSFVTIGDASTSEGVFWETINAAGVMQVPLAVMVWDDGYGISVPIKYQTTKASISEALRGFEGEGEGISIHTVKGWDYLALLKTFQEGVQHIRTSHQPALFHVQELTQPQGHSTSGSHERYKSKERLQWEKDMDCIEQMAKWMIAENITTQEAIDEIRREAKQYVKECRNRAWKAFTTPTKEEQQRLQQFYQELSQDDPRVNELSKQLKAMTHPLLSELLENGRRLYYHLHSIGHPQQERLKQWIDKALYKGRNVYKKHLHSEGSKAATRVPIVRPIISENSRYKNGYEILNAFFRSALDKYPELYAFGEDVGQIGGVNQGFAGLQSDFGVERIFDTGIREWTIMGQVIGMAMRGLRPIGEIQYLDYLIYGLQPLSDDLSTLRWRSNGQQKAPGIIRTRGHRLEGVWHAGSPLGMLINALRGMHICVPRDMVRAAGMYNTLLQSDEPAVVIECLNGYRLKERMPDNVGEYTVPLGSPDILRKGTDITLVTYGSCVRIAQDACQVLESMGIQVELIDAQTLLPFDLEHQIAGSLKKTNRLLLLDEDVPGGATAFMLQQITVVQEAYQYLDSAPSTLTAHPHRPPYGSDGDYFTKPNVEDVVERVRAIMHEVDPRRFPSL